nr:YolD-like family protein [Enterococcus cecorum]
MNLPSSIHSSMYRRHFPVYPMSMENRAAQFVPFAALTGFSDAITEKSKYYDSRPAILEDQLSELELQLKKIAILDDKEQMVKIRFFDETLSDDKGEIKEICEKILSVDLIKKQLFLDNDTIIPFKNLLEVEF